MALFVFVICAAVIGLVFWSGKLEYYYEFPWWQIVAYALLLAAFTSYGINEHFDSLWRALAGDYSGTPRDVTDWPRSGGMFGSTTHQDYSMAISLVSDGGIHFCRVRKYLRNTPWIMIPWSKIASIEVLKPDEDATSRATSKNDRRLLTTLMVAKIELIRKSNKMTLIVPWNYEFETSVPPTVEVVRDWEWPFSVM